jgi:hypothetical protein
MNGPEEEGWTDGYCHAATLIWGNRGLEILSILRLFQDLLSDITGWLEIIL